MDNFFGYKVNIGKETCTVTGYVGAYDYLDIPATIDGKTVTGISAKCFMNCKYLTKITIPSTVTNIASNAFDGCSELVEIELPESLVKLNSFAFKNCVKLKNVNFLNEDVVISKTAFTSANFIEEINFFVWKYLSSEQLLKVIPIKLLEFYSLSADEQKQIITFIKKRSALKKELFLTYDVNIFQILTEQKVNIDLLDLNIYLKHSIQKEHTEITAILLDYKNKNFSKAKIDAFDQNSELVQIGLELPTMKQFKANWVCKHVNGGICIDGYMGDNTVETIPETLACGTKIVAINYTQDSDFNGLVKLNILAKITEIPNKIFANNQTLEEVILPDSLTHIREFAFEKCPNLKTVIIPKSVTHIENQAFDNCTSLENIELPKKLEILGRSVFAKCLNLTSIVMPYRITEIPAYTFCECSALKTVTLSRDTTDIFDYAFFNCTSLETITNTRNIDNISLKGFTGCNSLANDNGFVIVNRFLCQSFANDCKVFVPNGVRRICAFAFFYNQNIEVVFPPSVELIKKRAFESCKDIIDVKIPINTDVENGIYSRSTLAPKK